MSGLVPHVNAARPGATVAGRAIVHGQAAWTDRSLRLVTSAGYSAFGVVDIGNVSVMSGGLLGMP